MTNINIMQKLSHTFQKLGNGLLQTGMTSVVLRNMNSGYCGNSIWFKHCRPSFGFGMNYGMGIPPQMMADPMGFTWLPNPMQTNYQNNAYGNMIAYQYAANLAAQAKLEAAANNYTYTSQLPKTNATYAGDIDKNQETDTGKAFDKATDDMQNNDEKGFDIINKYTNPDDKTKCAEEYRNSVSNLAKSYAANIDKSSGNSDNKVTSEEFINQELSKLDPNANAQVKAQAKQMALNAFNKIDQNGDGYADWKELAATIATFDTNTNVTQKSNRTKDGTINSKDYKNWSTLLSQQGANLFDTTVRNSYIQLFKDDNNK